MRQLPSGSTGWMSTLSTARAEAGLPRRLGVLGSPIAHSMSPALHTAAYRQLGLDWVYERVEVREGELVNFVRSRGTEWRGLSLTMPLKFVAAKLVDERDRVAELSGAVNTILFSPGDDGVPRLQGFNTDVAGIVRSLGDHEIRAVRHVVILGGGATAGSALLASAELGAEHVTVAVRTPAKAQPLRELAAALGLRLDVVTLDAVAQRAHDAQLIISTLPGGTAANIDFAAHTRQTVPLYDVAYSSWPSALGRDWIRSGGTAISGLGMLVQQALIQIRIFVGSDPSLVLPDEDAVLAAMRSVAGLSVPGSVEG